MRRREKNNVAYERCETCGLAVPDISKRINPFNVSCSKDHIRCIRCGWPVANIMIDEDEVCELCKGKKK